MTGCRPWCRNHFATYNPIEADDVDVCISDDLRLDFGCHGLHDIDCNEASVDMSMADDERAALMLHLNGDVAAALDPERAEAIAWALLSKVAQAKGDETAADYYRQLALEHAAASKAGA